MFDIYYFYPVIFVASFISTVAGYGTGALVVAFGMFFFSPREVLGITTLIFLVNNITKIFLFRKHIDVPIAKTFILWSIPAAVLGATLTAYIPPNAIQLLLGLVIVTYLLNKYVLSFKKVNIGNKAIKIASVLYGFITSITGTGGVIKAAVFIELNLVKEVFIGTFAITSFFVNITKLIIYTNYGYLHAGNINVALISIIFCISGILIGKQVLKYFVSEKLFEYLVTGMLVLSAAKLLFF